MSSVIHCVGLDPFARQMAALAARRAPDTEVGEAAARIAALLVLERARGHSCVQVPEWFGRELPLDADRDETWPLPEAATWQRVQATHPLFGEAGSGRPFVVEADGALYLARDHAAESRLASGLRQRLERRRVLLADPGIGPELMAWFEEDSTGLSLRAALTAYAEDLCVITGGPGTGKTTTVVKVLAVLLGASPTLRVALAAPTGKAAARLEESISSQRDALPVREEVRGAIPSNVSTLHRLLGYRPGAEHFAFGSERTLPYDVVVVDEASMLDLGMVDALVAALEPAARLLLVGDRHQLASVDAGSVLADIVEASSEGRFADVVVELTTNHRFRECPDLSALADAMRVGDAEAVLDLLDDPRHADVLRMEPPGPGSSLRGVLEPVIDHWAALADAPVEVRLREFESGTRILSALRRGRSGVEGIRTLVELSLLARGVDLDTQLGRPILVTRNDPELGVSNGDLGLAMRDPESGLEMLFLRSGAGTALRRIPLARLDGYEVAWAMTVHKSQGSEFDAVTLVLPGGPHPLLSRELLYTGVTRARRRVTVVATREAVVAAVRSVQRRRTRLVDRLRAD